MRINDKYRRRGLFELFIINNNINVKFKPQFITSNVKNIINILTI